METQNPITQNITDTHATNLHSATEKNQRQIPMAETSLANKNDIPQQEQNNA